MSAPFDLEILQLFIRETGGNGFEFGDDESAIRGSLLYICSAMADGNYCDFQFAFDTGANDYYASTRNCLDQLVCRPLLQPWLEERFWSAEEIAELKAAHQVTQALINKDTTP